MKYQFVIDLPIEESNLAIAEQYTKLTLDKDIISKENYETVTLEVKSFKENEDYWNKNYYINTWLPQFMKNIINETGLKIDVTDNLKIKPFQNDISVVSSSFNAFRLKITKILSNFVENNKYLNSSMIYDFKNLKGDNKESLDIIKEDSEKLKNYNERINKILQKKYEIEDLNNWKNDSKNITQVIINVEMFVKYTNANNILVEQLLKSLRSYLIYFYKNLLVMKSNWETIDYENIRTKIIETYNNVKVNKNFILFNHIIMTFDDLINYTNFSSNQFNTKNSKFNKNNKSYKLFKEGNLFKKGNGPIDFNWSERLFIFINNYLLYFDQTKKIMRSALIIEDSEVSDIKPFDGKNYAFSIKLKNQDKDIWLSHDKKEVILEWQKLIKYASKLKNFSKSKIDNSILSSKMNNTLNNISKLSKTKIDFNEFDEIMIDENEFELLKVKNNIRIFINNNDNNFLNDFNKLKSDNKTEGIKKEFFLVYLFLNIILFYLKFFYLGNLLFILLYLIKIFYDKKLYFFKNKKNNDVNIIHNVKTISKFSISKNKRDILKIIKQYETYTYWNTYIKSVNKNKNKYFIEMKLINNQIIEGILEIKIKKNGIINIYIKSVIENEVEFNFQINLKNYSEISHELSSNKNYIECIFSYKSNILNTKEDILKQIYVINESFNCLKNLSEEMDEKDLKKFLDISKKKKNNNFMEYNFKEIPKPHFNIYKFEKERENLKNMINGIDIPSGPNFENMKVGYFIRNARTCVCKNEKVLKLQKGIVSDLLKKIGKSIIGGKSLTLISLPVKIFEGKSTLQRLIDHWGLGPIYLPIAKDILDIKEQFKYVICFALGGLWNGVSQLKPFNPILGETYQGFWQDGTMIEMEHISHHPPISCFYIEDIEKKYVYSGRYEFKTKLATINSVFTIFQGPNVLEFKSNNTKYTWNIPKIKFSGISFGKRTCGLHGKAEFKEENSGFSATIDFEENLLKGSIKDSNNNILSTFEGKLYENFKFDKITYWDITKIPLAKVIPVNNSLNSDSRFREDLIWLLRNDLEKAQKFKLMLEQKQRKDKAMRLENPDYPKQKN